MWFGLGLVVVFVEGRSQALIEIGRNIYKNEGIKLPRK